MTVRKLAPALDGDVVHVDELSADLLDPAAGLTLADAIEETICRRRVAHSRRTRLIGPPPVLAPRARRWSATVTGSTAVVS